MQAGTGGTVGIHFMDQQRESYISIGLREGNAPYVVMRHGGAESLAITVEPKHNAPAIHLKGQNGASAMLSVTESGDSGSLLTDSDGS